MLYYHAGTVFILLIVRELVPILGQFKRLKKLGLVDASYLHVGFNPPMCGNAYMGPNGGEIRKQCKHGRPKQYEVALQTRSLAPASILKFWLSETARRQGLHGVPGEKFEKSNGVWRSKLKS